MLFRSDNIGNVWCSWGDGGCSNEGDFINFYSKWLKNVEVELLRYTKLKELKKRFDSFFGKFRKPTFDDIISRMDCKYSESAYDGSEYGVPHGQIWVHFEKTKGKIILNDNREILRIEIGN